MSIFQKSWHLNEKSFQTERFIFIDYLNVHISKDLNPKGYIKIVKNGQITAWYLGNEFWDFFTSIFMIINELNSQYMIGLYKTLSLPVTVYIYIVHYHCVFTVMRKGLNNQNLIHKIWAFSKPSITKMFIFFKKMSNKY